MGYNQFFLAKRVDLLGQVGDALKQCGGQSGVFVGEREFFKTVAVVVGGAVTNAKPATYPIGKGNMRTGLQNTQRKGI